MTTRAIAGWTALVSGGLLIVGIIATSIATSAGWVGPAAIGMGPAMMGGAAMPMGPGMMRGMGPMMGGRYAPAVTGSGPIAGAPEVAVRALNFQFEPSEIRLPKDKDVNLSLTNTTSVIHDLTIPALGVQIVAQPGTTRTVGLRAVPAGRYVAYCSVPGHADLGMRATVIVD